MKFGRSEIGQAIVEFALLLPALVLLLVGLMEFSLVWNSRNTVLFASRDGSMLAAEGGNIDGTDCLVLRRIESDIVSPSTTLRVQQVAIYWSDQNGDQIGSNLNAYDRGGSTTCDYGDGSSVTVPYTLSTAQYVEADRCDVLAGCGGPHNTVDTIGVRITYRHAWVTSFGRYIAGSITFQRSTAVRMEPTL